MVTVEGGNQEVKQVDTKGFVVGYVEGGLSLRAKKCLLYLLYTGTCYSCWLADGALPSILQYPCTCVSATLIG